jgi:hypothetical protein
MLVNLNFRLLISIHFFNLGNATKEAFMKTRNFVCLFTLLAIFSGAFLHGDCMMDVNDRRERLGFEPADAEKLQQLVGLQYFGTYKLGFGAGQYLDHGFSLSPSSENVIWYNKAGSYDTYHFHGYWIFIPGINECWQAVNANGPLDLWNKDGNAHGNPQDWELFIFEYADGTNSSVHVRNIWGKYVRYASPRFVCDADRNNAATFYPVF